MKALNHFLLMEYIYFLPVVTARKDWEGATFMYVIKKEITGVCHLTLEHQSIPNIWESQPAISPDGSTLYFVSNRPGGLGGYDIWKSTLKEDGYLG